MFFTANFPEQISLLTDHNHSKSLEDIPKLSDRIRSLIVRNKHKIRDKHDFAQIWGSLHLVQGIEYHYVNFLAHLSFLASKDTLGDDSMLSHEAVAYLNRVGQFYYFAKSVHRIDQCPKIRELYLFRIKSTAHRSIDSPKEDDQKSEQIWQAGCFMRRWFSGRLKSDFDPNRDLLRDSEILITPKRYLCDEALVSYQIISNGVHADFTPQKDHLLIIREIEELYINLFDSRSEARSN